jgi:hypothetical protein
MFDWFFGVPMGERYPHELNSREQQSAARREELSLDLEERISKLNEQARIFVPLIALCLIAAIPVLSKSLIRFLMLLLNPFVLLPLGFCLIHLAIAWAGIVKAKARIRDWKRTAGKLKDI